MRVLPGKASNSTLLTPFIIDASLDNERKVLRFLINTKVFDKSSPQIRNPLITDVGDYNTYTTLHVDVSFMGRKFEDTNIRFCNAIAVKNLSDFGESPRFDNNRQHPLFGNNDLGARLVENPSALGDIRKASIQDDDDIVVDSSRTYSKREGDYSSISDILKNNTGNLVQCPLYNNDTVSIYYETNVLDRFYELGSYTVTFSVFSNDEESQIIGSAKTYVTPVLHSSLTGALNLIVLILLLVTFMTNAAFVTYSSYQESTNPFLFMASTICNKNLLMQLEASLESIVAYFQFAFFLSALDLQYPGFFQPLMASIKWSSLLGFIIFKEGGKYLPVQDNVYITLDTGGIRSLLSFFSGSKLFYYWANFILTLLLWLAITIFASEFFFVVCKLYSFMKPTKYRGEDEKATIMNISTPNKYNIVFNFKWNFCFIMGILISHFLSYFSLPFLILSIFNLSTSAEKYGLINKWQFLRSIRANLFDFTVAYDDLFSDAPESSQMKLGSFAKQVMSLHQVTDFPVVKVPPSTKSQQPHAYSIVIISVMLAVWVGTALFFIFRYLITFKGWRIRINENVSWLYTSVKTILVWSFCYHKYHPKKVNFVIIDFGSTLAFLIIVACFQFNGLIQVTLLLVFELSYTTLFIWKKPLFVDLTWKSLACYLHLARLLLVILCIPCIRRLDVSEATRTRIAFSQLGIHALVAAIFVSRLLYCLYSTLLDIWSDRKEKLKDLERTHNLRETAEYFKSQFEYQPVDLHTNKSFLKSPLQKEYQTTYAFEVDCEPHKDDMSDFYFRGRNLVYFSEDENRIDRAICNNTEYVSHMNFGETMSASDLNSWKQNQLDARKAQTDYRFREGDAIYKKYFVDELINPEIKELWESRHNWSYTLQRSNHSRKRPSLGKGSNGKFLSRYSRLKRFFFHSFKTEKPKREFYVKRPKDLVVKPLSVAKDSP